MPDLRPVVSEAAILALLHDQFDAPVSDLVPVEGGSVARTFAFHAGNQEYIIRFNLDRMLGANFPKEAYLWQKLAPTPVPMPPVLQVGRLGDLHYAISRKMPGVMLMRLPPAEIEGLLPQIMETLDILHHLDVSDTHGYGVFDAHGRGMNTSWHDFLRLIAYEEQEDDYFGRWHHLFDDTFWSVTSLIAFMSTCCDCCRIAQKSGIWCMAVSAWPICLRTVGSSRPFWTGSMLATVTLSTMWRSRTFGRFPCTCGSAFAPITRS